MRLLFGTPVGGAYAIICVNGRAYVGGTINLASRWSGHKSRLRKGKHTNRWLQEAWDRMGSEAFRFEVLEFLAEGGDLIALEQKWLDNYRRRAGVFNIAMTAGTVRGYRHTEAAKRKTGEQTVQRCKDPVYRARLSAIAKKYNPRGSDNSVSKLTEADIPRIRALALAGVLHKDIAKEFGVVKSNISTILRGETWSHVK